MKKLKGMKLLKEGKSQKPFLFVPPRSNNDPFPSHSNAFKEAADELVAARMTATNGPNKDFLAEPILYLYRHALEHGLKDLVRLGVRYGEIMASASLKKSLGQHFLDPLWQAVKGMLLGSNLKRDQIDFIEARVKELETVDPDGQTLRYERDRTNKRNRPFNGIQTIDLENLLDVSRELFQILDGWHSGIWDFHMQEV